MSITAIASKTLKEINQDYVLWHVHPDSTSKYLLIADGLGSFHKAEVAAQKACEFLSQELNNVKNIDSLNSDDLKNIFRTVKSHLIDWVTENEDISKLDKLKAYGTTMICVIDTPDRFQIAYVGNGSVWHIRGNFNQFSANQYLPWNAINYLNPHSIPVKGKNALYKLISISDDFIQAEPTVIEISKDDQLYGDIILACTDGIYSYDEVDIGKDDDAQIWISGEESMELFFKYLDKFFQNENQELDEKRLGFQLEEYLQRFADKGLINDDSSLGVIITPKAIDFQKSIYQPKKNSQHVGNND